jgi:hypothetical protein
MSWATHGNDHIHINLSSGTHTGPAAIDFKLPKENKMTNLEYKYTDEWTGWSSAVEEALYDAPTGTFYIMLESGSVYAYEGVPQSVWNDFKRAISKGRFYAKTIKPNHGPGVALSDQDYESVQERDDSVPAPDMGAVTVGTPKDLHYSSTAKVDGRPAVELQGDGAARFSLVTNIQPALLEDRLPHTIRFVVGDSTVVKSYRLDAENVTEAVAVLNGIGDAVGLDFKVKEVVTHFE